MNLKEIASAAGVSQATVSLVRKGKQGVSDPVRQRIQALLTEHGFSYVEHDKQTGLPVGAPAPELTRCIRLLTYKKHAMLIDGNDGFVTSIINALDREARRAGYQLLVSVIGPDDQRSELESLAKIPADGALVIATEMMQEEQERLDAFQMPLVILDSDFIRSPYSCVTMNNRELAFAAVRHLIELGHPRIGYLRSAVTTGNFRSRTQGYLEAIHTIGQGEDDRLLFNLRPTLNAAYQDMRRQLQGRADLPSAFFADNDIIAIGAMKALTEIGLRIPHDISIVGVDNIPFGSVANPPLTTMSISCPDIGCWAIRLLLQSIQTPDMPKTKVQIGASLVRRNSTAPYKARQ